MATLTFTRDDVSGFTSGFVGTPVESDFVLGTPSSPSFGIFSIDGSGSDATGEGVSLSDFLFRQEGVLNLSALPATAIITHVRIRVPMTFNLDMFANAVSDPSSAQYDAEIGPVVNGTLNGHEFNGSGGSQPSVVSENFVKSGLDADINFDLSGEPLCRAKFVARFGFPTLDIQIDQLSVSGNTGTATIDFDLAISDWEMEVTYEASAGDWSQECLTNDAGVFGTPIVGLGWRDDAELFFGVATIDSVAHFVTSEDGREWDEFALPVEVGAVTSVIWVPSLSQYWMLAYDVSFTTLMTLSSSDGVAWTIEQDDISDSAGATLGDSRLTWAEGLGRFFVTGFSDQIGTSTDGVNWTAVSIASHGNSVLAFVWSEEEERSIAVAMDFLDPDAPLVLLTSTDGTTYTPVTTPDTLYAKGNFPQAIWAPGTGLFCLFAFKSTFTADPNEAHKLFTSPDGLNWTERVVPYPAESSGDTSNDWLGIREADTPSGPLLVSWGYSNDVPDTPLFIMKSFDGVTWELVDTELTSFLFGLSDLMPDDAAYSSSLGLLMIGSGGGLEFALFGAGLEGSTTGLSITAIDPDQGQTGGNIYVEVQGTGFDEDVEILFDQIPPLETIWNSSTSVTVKIPPHAVGFVDVTATNPDDGEFDTAVGAFEYVDDLGDPSIDCEATDPPNGSMLGGTTVTIYGTGFVEGSEVFFGDRPATNVVVDPSGTFLTCVTPAHPVGTVNISVTTPNLG